MFTDRKFEELDNMANEFLRKKSRFPDGAWKLQVFGSAFDLSTTTPQWVFGSFIALAEEWRTANPKSVAAQVTLSRLWGDYAWNARGGGYADDVKEDSWPVIQERLEKAWRIINEPLLPGSNDTPLRHNDLLRLAKVRGVDRYTFAKIFQEAIRQEPTYYHNYTIMTDYLLPKWHGDEGEWQRFLEGITNLNPTNEGATIYTRTAWSMFLGHDWQDFKGSGVSWDKMKTGFKEIDHNYPDSPWILNWYARFACRAGDLETMKILFKRIDTNNYYPEAWDKDNIEDCRNWVKLGKSRQEIDLEKLADHFRKLDVSVFLNILEMAEKGNRKVIDDLANMYLKGRGTSADPIAAYAWLAQDESANKDQLSSIAKTLSTEQLGLAKQRTEAIRRRTTL